jgi:hypothetical protein
MRPWRWPGSREPRGPGRQWGNLVILSPSLASIRRRHHRNLHHQPETSWCLCNCESWAENPAEAPEVKPRLAMLHPGRTVDIPL